MKWMSGSTKRQCDRARPARRAPCTARAYRASRPRAPRSSRCGSPRWRWRTCGGRRGHKSRRERGFRFFHHVAWQLSLRYNVCDGHPQSPRGSAPRRTARPRRPPGTRPAAGSLPGRPWPGPRRRGGGGRRRSPASAGSSRGRTRRRPPPRPAPARAIGALRTCYVNW